MLPAYGAWKSTKAKWIEPLPLLSSLTCKHHHMHCQLVSCLAPPASQGHYRTQAADCKLPSTAGTTFNMCVLAEGCCRHCGPDSISAEQGGVLRCTFMGEGDGMVDVWEM